MFDKGDLLTFGHMGVNTSCHRGQCRQKKGKFYQFHIIHLLWKNQKETQ
jgi:hypothetical protein